LQARDDGGKNGALVGKARIEFAFRNSGEFRNVRCAGKFESVF
jgi:hypothetical protein